MKPFDNKAAHRYFDLLGEIVKSPPSDQMMDAKLVQMHTVFYALGDSSPLAVWNHYKKALDFTVRYSWGGSFAVTLFDLEPYYDAPQGGYAQRDRSIDSAPWRNDETL